MGPIEGSGEPGELLIQALALIDLSMSAIVDITSTMVLGCRQLLGIR
jgi:hypothetical protein